LKVGDPYRWITIFGRIRGRKLENYIATNFHEWNFDNSIAALFVIIRVIRGNKIKKVSRKRDT